MRDPTQDDIQVFLQEVDTCLFTNRCLSYHQILSYKHKISLFQSQDFVLATAETQTLDDLQLAEVNYLCIKAALRESRQADRQNTLNYCLDHLKNLFEGGEYLKAVNTTFVTQTASHSWQMVLVFCVVFAIIILSIILMCRFMKNKRKGQRRPHSHSNQ